MGYAASFYLEFAQINYARDLWLNINAIQKDVDTLEALSPIKGGEVKAPDLSEQMAVKLENVAFSYAGSGTAEKQNYHLEVKTGEKVAIVGPSGEGKSTLLRLLCRLVEPDSGEIYLFGHRIEEYALEALRKIVVYMPQNTGLWDGSIEENVFWGKSAGDCAGFARKMKQLNLRYDMQKKLKVGGTNLSGGEAQRISFLRALYSHGNLLLLDEPTSNMDTDNTNIVYDMIRGIPRTCTVIIVTHDRKIHEFVDRVIEIDELRKNPDALYEREQK